MHARTEIEGASLAAVSRIVDAAWEELRRSLYVQRRLGAIPARLPDLSFAEAQRRSAVGRSLLKQLDGLDHGRLPHDLELTLRVVRFRANTWSREADWYWLAVDPLRIGFFGLFLPTAYCGGWLLNAVNQTLASFSFSERGDTDRYLGLVADYVRLIDQFAERTVGQVHRGIWMPRVQVRQARALLNGFKSRVRAALTVEPGRLGTLPSDHFSRELERRITAEVEPAFDRALEGLSDAYLAQAPESVGLSQYPGGMDLYCELVKFHTTLDLTPHQVHARGLDRIAAIGEQMRAIRAEWGFHGDHASFLKHLDEQPRWRANTVEGVAAVFQNYIDRLKPHLQHYFAVPKAPYRAVPLPEALQSSMTYGYYDAPGDDRAEGWYLFNAANLTQKALFTLGTLTYHELMPGHHLHFSSQQENELLHPFRKYGFLNAFNEGWAEYAATLVGEIGLYENPEERYGRLVMESFLTSRLVVDTGMNALGWSLERARDYLRGYSGMEEAEVLTESVRYSCDIPGQALAYKLGDTQILELRERMRCKLGTRFDLKDFHNAVLAPGALPLPDLEWHIEHETRRLKEREEEIAMASAREGRLVIDGLIVSKWDRCIFEEMHEAGLSAANCTVSIWEGFKETVANIADMKRLIRTNSDLLSLVRTTADIEEAQRANRTGVILGFQNGQAFEDNLGTIEAFWDMGVRVVQLCYNTQNYIGTGCYERDGGLSGYGREVIAEMNRLGMMIDLSHVGPQTAEEAIVESRSPVCYSHCAPAGLKQHPRNKSDEQLRFIASRGGLIGVTLFPGFLKRGADATVDDYVEAIDYVINLVGEDSVAYGSDFMQGYGPEFFDWVTHDKGRHRRLTEFKTVVNPAGIRTIGETSNLVIAMERAHWSAMRMDKILGLNWLRVFREVWRA